jgi:poly(3-hydroxybutyrate) depolymerase
MRLRRQRLLLLLTCAAACARIASSDGDATLTAAPAAAARGAACLVEGGTLRADARNRVRITRTGRTFLLALPPGATNATSAASFPLLYVIHGYSENAALILDRTRLDALATSRGFLVAAPQGDPGTNGAWSLGNAPGDGRPTDGLADADDEVTFLNDVAACIGDALQLPLRAGGVFVAGLSQGGKVACRFACGARSGGGVRVRGLALAAGVQAEANRRCASGGRVPTLVFYGGADAVTPLCSRGGFAYRPGGEDVDAWARGAGYNACNARTPPRALCPAFLRDAMSSSAWSLDTLGAAATSTRVFLYDAGCTSAPLALYWLPLGIHAWPDALPGVGATASEVAFDFFDALARGASPARSSVMMPRGGFAPCDERRPCDGRLGAGAPGEL